MRSSERSGTVASVAFVAGLFALTSACNDEVPLFFGPVTDVAGDVGSDTASDTIGADADLDVITPDTRPFDTAPSDVPPSDTESDVSETDADLPDTPADVEIPDVEDAGEPCIYPGPVGFTRGAVFPDLAWNAQRPDGTELVFDLYEFYCEWDRYESLAIIVTAAWDPNSPTLMSWVDEMADELDALGMLVLFLNLQDDQGRTTYTDESADMFSRYASSPSLVWAGDGDGLNSVDGVLNSGIVEFFPTSIVIRRSDMVFIADQRDTSYYLPYRAIAADPDADWSSPPEPEEWPP